MSASSVFHALRGNSKAITLDNNHLKELPPAIVRLQSLNVLSAKNNQLSDNTSNVLEKLPQLSSINLGGNCLSRLPIQYSWHCCQCLTSLYLFDNQITSLDEDTIVQLVQLKKLNLNNNLLQLIPSSIGSLSQLILLSLAYNRIQEVTVEICKLDQLNELHLEGNSINDLPNGIGKLKKLKKLYLQKNELQHLPSSIGGCTGLRTLDVSCNRIQLFPNEIRQLSLEEFHFEHNPLMPPIPLPCDQITEILPLQELTGRFLVTELAKDTGLARRIQTNSIMEELLSKVGICSVCKGPYLHSWLGCVEFVHTKKLFISLNHEGQILPIQIILCSHLCFNKEHNYFGIALLPQITIKSH